jgi:hypothetical protein
VAAARGLLAAAVPVRAEEIDRGFAPRLGPSEWRRVATSLAAMVSQNPDRATTAQPVRSLPFRT